jgi:mRNA interferase MazF
MRARRGDIVLLPYPFTDLSSIKVRPALVVSGDSFNKTGESIFVFITTKIYNNPFDFRLEENSEEFKKTGLKTSSTFRVGKLICLEQNLIQRKLGYAGGNILNKIDNQLRILFELYN